MTDTVLVKFDSSPNQVYSYFIRDGDQPVRGDIVITSFDALHLREVDTKPYYTTKKSVMQSMPGVYTSIKYATVQYVEPGQNPKANKPYLWLIPAQELAARHESMVNWLRDKAAKEEAREKLKKIAMDRLWQHELFRKMAETDEEVARLLAILEG